METPEEDELLFAMIVNELTAGFIRPITCDDIHNTRYSQSPTGVNTRIVDDVIYFGAKEDFEDGNAVEELMTLAIMDKYNFDEQFAGFYYNEDPACRK